METLSEINAEVVACRRCPRLVAWREEVARTRRTAYAGWDYWGRPIPGFGDPEAAVAVVGLAPGAHGSNRTGRMFTGDSAGAFLFVSLHRTGFATIPTSTHRDDALVLRGAYVSAVVRCVPPANKPAPDERDACVGYLARELAALPRLRVIVALGGFAYEAVARLLGVPRPIPRFGHGVEVEAPGGVTILCSYHPSQQNTFTGRLTPDMLDGIFRRAHELAEQPRSSATESG